MGRTALACERNSWRGSKYCWHHTVKDKDWSFGLLMAIVGALCGAAISVPISCASDRAMNDRADHRSYLERPKRFPQAAAEDEIVFGMLSFQQSTGVPIPLCDNLILGIDDEGILNLEGDLMGSTGAMVAQLTGSSVEITGPNNAVDINFDHNAIEIVDELSRPIVQVYRSRIKRWDVFVAAYYADGSGCLCTREVVAQAPMPAEMVPAARSDRKRLFDYPGYKNIGVRTVEGARIAQEIREARAASKQ